jgi:prepilin-type N-terminal cleavage/methylation domain-containing protein
MKKYLAFTFIEMMIALTVFSIGVLAVMRLITQNLSSMDVAETTTIATFLAKE